MKRKYLNCMCACSNIQNQMTYICSEIMYEKAMGYKNKGMYDHIRLCKNIPILLYTISS